MDIGGRIKAIRGATSQDEFSKDLGIHKNTLGKYERGERIPDADLLKLLLETYPEIDPAWLLTGEGAKLREEEYERLRGAAALGVEEKGADWKKGDQGAIYHKLPNIELKGFVTVPRYQVAASAGHGAMVHSEQIVDHLAFKADWLKVSLGLSPSHVAVISVIGDSMEPYLTEGDLILIDLAVKHIENDAVYVLQFGDSLLVKRVQVKLDSEVIVKSDNPKYEAQIFRGDAAERLRVVGRMVRRLVR